MPQQLIYTSAPRGVVAGRSGHCTVARSAAMRDALMLQLEKFSYYQHLSLSGGQERPIHCCRITEIRGSRYHVLTRIQDAGLDFTGRTNFLAHHLVFAPEEVRQFASPPVILRNWPGWINSWSKDPELFENEDWSSLAGLSGRTLVPAMAWQQLTSDAVNGYGLLETRGGVSFRVDGMDEPQILALFAESLELLEMRDPRRDFRASGWQYTFTTSMQEQDNPADFRWRCLHSDNPASNRFAGPDVRALADVRAGRTTTEESTLARAGRQPPKFVVAPQNLSAREGETARFEAKAEGVPAPAYQWFTMDRTGNQKPIANASSAELQVKNPPLGVTRYVVRAVNSEGEATSDVVTLSIEQKARSAGVRPATEPSAVGSPAPARLAPTTRPAVKSEEDIERQRRRLEASQAEAAYLKQKQRTKVMLACVALGIVLAGSAVWWLLASAKPPEPKANPVSENTTTNEEDTHPPIPPATPLKTESRPVAVPQETEKPESSVFEPLSDSITRPPAPWESRQIGRVVTRTSAVADKDEFIVNGGGENINGHLDNFFFLRRPASNSVDFVARLKAANLLNASRHGIMVRGSDNPDAAFAFVGLSQSSIFWLHRDDSASTCQFMTQPIPQLPVFLKLSRKKDLVSGAFSVNGSSWTWLGTNRVTLPDTNYLIGFAVSSGNNLNSVRSRFDGIKIAEGARTQN
jgi:hypothetical protein